MPEEYMSSQQYVPSQIIAGDMTVDTIEVTIEAGDGVRQEGDVLGRVTATGEYKLSLAAAVDGSEVPDVIFIGSDADASVNAAKGLAIRHGQVGESYLTLGAGHTLDSIRDGLRDKGIFLVKTVAV